MEGLTIDKAFEDPKIFGSLIKDQSTWTSWKVVLKAIFGLPMDPVELKTYKKHTGRKRVPENPFSEVFLIIGRRGGKSFISALIAVYLAVFRDWKQYLSPGERGFIMCIASDRKQAKVVLDYIRAILRLPVFRKLVTSELKEEIELSNQVTISVVTCSYRALRGYTVLAVICDELAFWRVEGSNPANEILVALRPSLGTVPGSLLLAPSTAYLRTGPPYEAVRDKYGREDPDTLVWRAGTLDMNPTYSKKVIDKALRDDPSAARAEYFAEFREDLETFIPMEVIDSCVVRGRLVLPPVEGVSYFAFVDPSGGRADSFTAAIAHMSEDKKTAILDRILERRPPFRPKSVVAEYARILKEYGISKVMGDRYSGEWCSSAFRDEGIAYENSSLSKSDIFLEFEPLLMQGLVELPDLKRLHSQLRGLERRTRSGGKDLIDHYPGGQDDLANSVAGVCVKAVKMRP
jgi:hypothetical protein